MSNEGVCRTAPATRGLLIITEKRKHLPDSVPMSTQRQPSYPRLQHEAASLLAYALGWLKKVIFNILISNPTCRVQDVQ